MSAATTTADSSSSSASSFLLQRVQPAMSAGTSFGGRAAVGNALGAFTAVVCVWLLVAYL